MSSFKLRVLDIELSFKTEADPEQVEIARHLVEDRFASLGLDQLRGKVAKDKLLIFLALSLADDLSQINGRLEKLLEKLEELK